MTTAQSPLAALQAQADRIATMLKAAERGEKVANDPAGKIAAARTQESVKFVVAMDDKTIIIEMPWKKIRETSRTGIAAWVLDQMREARQSVH